jgi:catechol 2,3-dioxygenase-like lactoylglutathione lyase family enzyme
MPETAQTHSTIGLTPELGVTDLAESLAFWCGVLGFAMVYERPEEHFALIQRGLVRFMLEKQVGVANRFAVGPLERPFGRGVNFEIEVDTIDNLVVRLADANWPLFLPPEEKWYRAGSEELGVRQFLVQDPDGYLLRFQQNIGRRPAAPTTQGT